MKTDRQAPLSIAGIIPLVGLLNRAIIRLPFFGQRILAFSNRQLGAMLPHLTFFGFRKGAGYENAIRNWELFLDMIGADYTVAPESPDARVYTIYRCPAGYCRPGHLHACQATMHLDHSLVESSGARLIVEKRFPVDGVCVERIIPS